MAVSDEKVKIVPPAKVHVDTGSAAVCADAISTEAEDIEATEDEQVRRDERTASAGAAAAERDQ
jgi:hypothetical protein